MSTKQRIVKEMKQLHIDARMIGATGIGTYLFNILSRAHSLSDKYELNLHGPSKPLEEISEKFGLRAKIHSMKPAPYALMPTLIPFGNKLSVENLWVPHYNAPLIGVKNLVATVHDVLHLREQSAKYLSPQRVYARLVLSRLRTHAKHIVFDSNFSRDEFQSLVGSPVKSSVIPIGVDKIWKIRSEIGAVGASDRPFILYVGNHRRHKNLALLLEAYIRLPENYEWDLAVIGPQDIRNADTHPILSGVESHPRIKILGKVSFDSLRTNVRNARSLIFPSSYEGFGLPPLEALAAGTPVLASDIPVLREVLGDRVDYFSLGTIDNLIHALLQIQGPKPELPPLEGYHWDHTSESLFQIFDQTFN